MKLSEKIKEAIMTGAEVTDSMLRSWSEEAYNFETTTEVKQENAEAQEQEHLDQITELSARLAEYEGHPCIDDADAIEDAHWLQEIFLLDTAKDLQQVIEAVFTLRALDLAKSPWSRRFQAENWIECAEEELVELARAINGGDYPAMIEEAGDVLGTFISLIIYLQARGIDFRAVVRCQQDKFSRRKPWVNFDGGKAPATPQAEEALWDKAKGKERKWVL